MKSHRPSSTAPWGAGFQWAGDAQGAAVKRGGGRCNRGSGWRGLSLISAGDHTPWVSMTLEIWLGTPQLILCTYMSRVASVLFSLNLTLDPLVPERLLYVEELLCSLSRSAGIHYLKTGCLDTLMSLIIQSGYWNYLTFLRWTKLPQTGQTLYSSACKDTVIGMMPPLYTLFP